MSQGRGSAYASGTELSQGRGSAYASGFVAVLILLNLIAQFGIAQAQANFFIVGGDEGWTFTLTNWPVGKRFVAGDVLVFKYNPRYHNVVEVSEEDYESCTIPTDSKPYRSGFDKIVLAPGKQYFVCGVPGHCARGMKIALDVI